MVGAGGGWLAGCANECARDEQVERGGPWWWNGSTYGKAWGRRNMQAGLASAQHYSSGSREMRCGVAVAGSELVRLSLLLLEPRGNRQEGETRGRPEDRNCYAPPP